VSNTNKGSKGPGYDYGKRRYGNKSGMNSPGGKPDTKRITNRAERRIGKQGLTPETPKDNKE
jgi:hypothetical protein